MHLVDEIDYNFINKLINTVACEIMLPVKVKEFSKFKSVLEKIGESMNKS